MKPTLLVALTSGILLIGVESAQAGKTQAGKTQDPWLVFDTHPTGGPGATGEHMTFDFNDPRIEGPGKCGHMFLGGFAFGHPDPRIKNPEAVCGHGYAAPAGPPHTGPAPLSILPIEAPMPVESGSASAVDAAKLIRDMLPKIDKSDGDKMPVVIQIRDTIRSLDVLSSAKSTPKRQVRQ
jgi:hypothetical protein